MTFEAALPGDGPVFRRALYAGRLFLLAPTPASLRLRDEVAVELERELGGDGPVREAQFRLSAEEFFRRIGRLRKLFYTEPRFHDLVRDVIQGLGLDAGELAFDPVRLRVIEHRGFENPKAAPVYHGHRDTWYANPQSQITWWIALHDVTEEETFVFWPRYFNRPVRNDSEAFDHDEWVRADQRRKIGWQDPETGREALYPRLQEEPSDEARLTFSARAGQILLFSGQHLHRTNRLANGRTRFSADFRTVHLADERDGIGAANVDNRSRGSALPSHVLPRESGR